MLVLKRKPGETILIGDPPNQIVVTYVGPGRQSSQAKIGIEAPPEVRIVRAELEEGKDHDS